MSLADEMFQATMDRRPWSATMFGLPGWDDRLEDLSVPGEQALRARIADILRRSETSDEDPVTLAVIRHQGESILTRIDARLVEHTVATGLNAPVNGLLMLASQFDVSQRLGEIARYVGQAGERIRDSDRRPLRRHLQAGTTRLERFLAAPVQEWEADHSTEIRTAVAGFRDVLASIEDGRGDDRPGLCWLPDGERNYANLVRDFTTTSRTPAELHQLGLDLIARLRDEYAEIGSRLWGTSDVPEIFHRLRTELLWDNEEEMVASAVEAMARAEAEAPKWFGRMPKAGCQVRAVDVAERETAGIAFYLSAPLDGSRPGTYWLNPLGATERSRTLSEATAFHEAIPGHHYQRSIAAETDLHDIRKFASIIGLRRGLGPVHRTARRRDGPVLVGRATPRHAGAGRDACRPAGGRHRHARVRVDPAAGRRLPARAHRAWRSPRSRPRSTGTSRCPARRSRTWWGAWRSSAYAKKRPPGWATAST